MCLFCDILENNKEKVLYDNQSFFIIYDEFPVSKGHSLIISKRHIENFFLLREDEMMDLHDAILHQKNIIDVLHQPDGYNIGINNGVDAGQSIMHLHIHLIPRYHQDVVHVRGGVRAVIPGKQNY